MIAKMRSHIPSVSAWRHRDGGFVFHLSGDLWMVEVTYAHRRRDRYGVRHPFTVNTTLYERGADDD